jgi:hypothetical protein
MFSQFLKQGFTALLIAFCFVLSAQAQTKAPAKPCGSQPEYRQLDFWIGEWDVEVKGQQAGTSSIQVILGKCVILENWAGAKGMNGKSFNIYNAAKGKWQQTWVDDTGGVLEFTGEYKEGAMRFLAEVPRKDGRKTLNRMTFSPLAEGRVRQLIEASKDDGKTWQVSFDGTYVRKKAAAAQPQ